MDNNQWNKKAPEYTEEQKKRYRKMQEGATQMPEWLKNIRDALTKKEKNEKEAK